MDEFFALEDLVYLVGGVITLGYEHQKEIVDEVKVDPEEDEARKAKLAAKEKARRDKAKADADAGDAPEDGDEGAKKPEFEPLMYIWSSTNKDPKNLAQLYN
jgi:hypothetical protein